MPKKSLKRMKPGLTKSLVRPIEFRRTIARFNPRMPPVVSTPSMIGQMEVTAGRVMRPFMPRRAVSLGTHINVSHVAPGRVGEKLRTTATFARIYKPKNGSRLRYVFEVEARVGRRLIGAGTVERAVVGLDGSSERLRPRRARTGKRKAKKRKM